MLARVLACAVLGLDGRIIEVEVDFNPRGGIPSFTLVGLPDATVKESRERVRAAIKNSNRSTRRRSRGASHQVMDNIGTSFEGQNQQGIEEHGFGLQFPNHNPIINLVPLSKSKNFNR